MERIKVGAFDLDGVLRGKYISPDKFASAAKSGLGFCDVIFGWDIADVLYEGTGVTLTGWHTGYPDAVARIDETTRREIPWEPATTFYLMDLFHKDGSPMAVSPRQVLRHTVAQAAALGYVPWMGAEYEFWIFRETPESLRQKHYQGLTPLTPGMFGYSVLRASMQSALVLDLMDQLNRFGIDLEGFHTETGPGVYEAAIGVDLALRAADKAALFKTAVKEIAAKHAVIPTFMAKWNASLPGSSGHIHQSLWDVDRQCNLFAGEGAAPMSRVMESYIAGLVRFLPELMAMICPTVNSYKRTVPGTWAPVNATWGIDSRTTAVRAIPGGAKSTRIELRLSGADMNAYLAMAAAIAAGVEGVRLGLEPPAPVNNAYAAESAPALPRSLAEASRALRGSELARRWFGDAFVDHFTATRDWEVREFERAVTDWELARYFESI